MKRASRLAARLIETRRERGLSQRALAKLAGVSWITIRNIERGADARRSTAARILAAVPSLRPEDILPSPAPPAGDELWNFYRDAFGFSAESIEKIVRIKRTGRADTEWRHVNLRSLRGSVRSLGIIHGLQRVLFSGSKGVLRQIQADARGVKSKVIEKREGRNVHLFQMPRRGLLGGLSYTRFMTRSAKFYLRSERYPSPHAGEIVEGVSLVIQHPAERARLIVEFPPGYWPASVDAVTWPSVELPNPELEPLSALLQACRPVVQEDRLARTLVLDVARPLVGTKLAIGWRLPRQHG